MVQAKDNEGFYNCDLAHRCQFSLFPLVLKIFFILLKTGL